MKIFRSVGVALGALALIATVAYAGLYNFPFASSTATSRSAATLPMTGAECIPGDTNLSGGRAPQEACYTQGNLQGNYITTITSASTTLAWSVADSARLYKVTLQGNNLIDNPTGATAGQVINLLIVQDATGSRVPTWGSNIVWPALSSAGVRTAPTLTSTPSQADILTFFYDGSKFMSTKNQTFGQGLVP